ncbi:MAG TPA: hypothetical protein DEV59_02870 [Proteus sp.]|nr:hypothetical protein [Proteus sp. (in: enterobacteria)]
MLKNNIFNTNNLFKFVFSVCITMVSFLCYSLYKTVSEQNLNKFDFCLESRCINFLTKEITGVIALAQFFGWLITLIAVIGGAMIALRTYVSGVENSNITNHIAHFSLFRDFVSSEISKRKRISPDTVDIHKWYSIIFPNSKNGSLKYNSKYMDFLNGISNVILGANYQIDNLKGDYKYKVHQEKMIDSMKNIGITLSRGPKNIFTEIEPEVFQLIDSVNVAFIENDILLNSIERKYMN